MTNGGSFERARRKYGGMMRSVDAVVIGAGFFGCKVAIALRELGLGRVLLVEREGDIMRRASFVNQARVHNGYHYPRSFPTAQRARENYPRFCKDYSFAIDPGMKKYYAIARGSKVTSDQFVQFCEGIGAPCRPAWSRLSPLFDADFVDDVFEVEELAFDASLIAARLRTELKQAGVEMLFGVTAHVDDIDDPIRLSLSGERCIASTVFNCTYADIDRAGCRVSTPVKRELAEMALIVPPPELNGVGVTVMDGPFFSVMPFPAAGLHTLSHVRYTPHASWSAPGDARPQPQRSNAEIMLRDAQRFMPCLGNARLRGSIFDIKAVLSRHEDDDARPVLYEADPRNPRMISILGSKIDNIYDVIETIETSLLQTSTKPPRRAADRGNQASASRTTPGTTS